MQAAALFTKAIEIARLRKHRNLAPAMTDLADLACARGDFAMGLALVTEARPIMAATYPSDPWRIAWTDFVRGMCLVKSGKSAEGAALMRASGAVLQRRWGSETLYGAIVSNWQTKLPGQ